MVTDWQTPLHSGSFAPASPNPIGTQDRIRSVVRLQAKKTKKRLIKTMTDNNSSNKKTKLKE